MLLAEKEPEPPMPIVASEDDVDVEPEMVEVLKAPENTPITVNTVAGREVILKFSSDCYIAATLTEEEGTADTIATVLPYLMAMADMRYGGLTESRDRMRTLHGPEVSGG